MDREETYDKWQTKFNECLALEFSDPEYFKVHHILVPTFLLQVGAYAEPVREEALQLLKQFLLQPEKAPTKAVISSINQKVELQKAEYGGLRNSQARPIFPERSILDVRNDTAEHYCADVIQWSKWLVNELENN